jgi:hypothetical protein
LLCFSRKARPSRPLFHEPTRPCCARVAAVASQAGNTAENPISCEACNGVALRDGNFPPCPAASAPLYYQLVAASFQRGPSQLSAGASSRPRRSDLSQTCRTLLRTCAYPLPHGPDGCGEVRSRLLASAFCWLRFCFVPFTSTVIACRSCCSTPPSRSLLPAKRSLVRLHSALLDANFVGSQSLVCLLSS